MGKFGSEAKVLSAVTLRKIRLPVPHSLLGHCLLGNLEMYGAAYLRPGDVGRSASGDCLEFIGCKIEIDLKQLLAEF